MNAYKARRSRVRQSLDGIVIIAAASRMQASLDVPYKFRQDSNFYYLSGVNEPDWLLVMDCAKQEEFFIKPQLTTAAILFEGKADIAKTQAVSKVASIYPYKEGWKKLAGMIKKQKRVNALGAFPSYYHGIASNPAREKLIEKLKRAGAAINTDQISIKLREMRSIKEPGEIEKIQDAVNITVETLQNVLTNLASYANERQIESDITAGFLKNDPAGHAYEPIVAAGKNATIIHYVNNNDIISDNDLVLIDAGAYKNAYCADISRTFAACSEPTQRQQDVYTAVEAVTKHALETIKPGLSWKDYLQSVDKTMVGELKKLKLVDREHDTEKLKKYFPHLVSHSLGLDVHDPLDYQGVLRENMVITVEPGIYIPEEGIGVRLEEDVLVTKNGAMVLSSNLQRDIQKA